MPASSEAAETNVVETAAGASPVAPQSGPYRVGSAPWTLALPSPIALHATTPPLKTMNGFTPKYDASHSTRSAIRPGRASRPRPRCRGRAPAPRSPSRGSEAPARCRRRSPLPALAFITWASCSVRRSVSPIRPSPGSRSSRSRSRRARAAVPRLPSWPDGRARGPRATSSGSRRVPLVDDQLHVELLGGRSTARRGCVGVVEEQKHVRLRGTIRAASGMWPPPEPSTW